MTDQSMAFLAGRFFARHKAISVVAVIAGVAMAVVLLNTSDPVAQTKTTRPTIAAAPLVDPLKELCGPGLDALIARAETAFQNKDFHEAEMLLYQCAGRMKSDSTGYQLYTKAQREAEKKAKAEKKKAGVSLGMTPEDVLASSWGKPEKINRTTSVGSLREQWVYGSGNYLYFQNGVLVTIQH